MHADTREKGMVRCEKRISTEEEAAAGTRKGRRKGGAHRARERAQMPEMRENRTGTHQVSFRARAQQSTMHATRRSANLGFEAGRRGGKEDGSCEEPQPSRRRQAEHSHAHALAACGARGGGCRGEGGDRAREHTPLLRGDAPDSPKSRGVGQSPEAEPSVRIGLETIRRLTLRLSRKPSRKLHLGRSATCMFVTHKGGVKGGCEILTPGRERQGVNARV